MPPIRDTSLRFGFLGCGQMGYAMAKALVGKIACEADKVNVFDVSESRRTFLKEKGFNVLDSNRTTIECSHVVVLCVKPNECISLLSREQRALDSKLIISVAAGIQLETLAKAAPKSRIVRIVTNLAAVRNSAVSAYSTWTNCRKEDDDTVEDFLNCFGASVGKVHESKLHAVSAVSSSSLAFISMVIEGMSKGGVQLGLPIDLATKLAAHAVIGTGKLLTSDKEEGCDNADNSSVSLSPAMLVNCVCSPGGTSIRGVQSLEKHAVRSAFMEAVIDTCNRSIEIMKQCDNQQ